MTSENEQGADAAAAAEDVYRQARDQAAAQADYDVEAGLNRLSAWMRDDVASVSTAVVLPRALGVLTLDGTDLLAQTNLRNARRIITHFLHANTQLPAESTFHAATVVDGQQVIELQIYEQAGAVESPEPAFNRVILSTRIEDLPPAMPAGSPIEFSIRVSETGRLTVRGTIGPLTRNILEADLVLSDPGLAEEMCQAPQSVARHRPAGD